MLTWYSRPPTCLFYPKSVQNWVVLAPCNHVFHSCNKIARQLQFYAPNRNRRFWFLCKRRPRLKRPDFLVWDPNDPFWFRRDETFWFIFLPLRFSNIESARSPAVLIRTRLQSGKRSVSAMWGIISRARICSVSCSVNLILCPIFGKIWLFLILIQILF